MWQRKTPEELEDTEIRAGRNPVGPLMAGGFVALSFIFFLDMSLTSFLVGFIVGVILGYLGQSIVGDPFTFVDPGGASIPLDATVICNRCHHITTMGKSRPCDCGGTYELFRNWKWVDDEKDELPV